MEVQCLHSIMPCLPNVCLLIQNRSAVRDLIIALCRKCLQSNMSQDCLLFDPHLEARSREVKRIQSSANELATVEIDCGFCHTCRCGSLPSLLHIDECGCASLTFTSRPSRQRLVANKLNQQPRHLISVLLFPFNRVFCNSCNFFTDSLHFHLPACHI